MNAVTALLHRHPVVFFHLVTALAALILGIVILSRRKGTGSHRALGWGWVALMASTAIATLFIRDYRMPNIAGFTPIHLFTVMTAISLPLAIWHIRHGNVSAHRKAMQGLFVGGCVVAGIFTLVPGRFLGDLLLRQGLSMMA
jgi:uncharacterized membrane protein